MNDPKDARPDDLISMTRAATIAERSERTIRRWTSPEVGKLQRWEGQPPDTGGPAPVLVSERELMVILATSGQKPRSSGPDTLDTVPDIPGDKPPDMAARAPDSVQVARLQGQLQAAELRAELAAVTAERDGLAGLVDDLRDQVTEQRRRWNIERQDYRSDLDRERDRVMALEAELKVIRGSQGLPWWRKLIGGPTAQLPAPEAK